MARQQRQIPVPFEQARGLEFNHRKAIEQIFPELLGSDHGPEIAMGRRDNADVIFAGLQRTQPLEP